MLEQPKLPPIGLPGAACRPRVESKKPRAVLFIGEIMKSLLLVVGAASLLMAGVAQAQSGADVLKANKCMNCHDMEKKKAGPALKDIAAKYKSDKGAEAKLIDKIKKGGSGAWGAVPMPPNPSVSDADLKTLVTWILATK